MAVGTRAADVYEVVLEEAPAQRRRLRALATLAVGFLTWGAGSANPGGRRVVITDRAGDALRAMWVEPYGDDTNAVVDRILTDHATLDADEFAARWIDTASPAPS